MRIAEYACRVNPMPVLDAVIEDEKQYREYSKRGRPRVTYDNRPTTSLPEWEYAYYLEHGHPVHEILRAWCGHRAVTLQERLAARPRCGGWTNCSPACWTNSKPTTTP